MSKVRQDAWSHEDDLLLAETVLRHVREGSTQLNAFEEVGDALNRTSAACGFRWNAEVRGKYDSAMELAKRQRKEKKRSLQNNQRKQQNRLRNLTSNNKSEQASLIKDETTITMDTVIHFLTNIQNEYIASNQSQHSLEQVSKENELLREHVKGLEKEIEQTEKKLAAIQEDYQTFIQIMERARKMTVLDDQGTLKAPMFKMDKNGNLEQLVQGHHP